MSIVVLIALLSLRNIDANTIPACTEALCCHENRFGYCSGNTHAAPVGAADPLPLSSSAQQAAGTGFTNCGAGYKDKVNKDTIKATAVSGCCDAKTCSDLTCSTGTKMKSSPTQPTAGNDPSQTDCCEAITGMCSGNQASGSDITCGTGYKDKANKASIVGTAVAACCDVKTCSDLTCSTRMKYKSSLTQPTAGNDPSQTDCCEAITGMCLGNHVSSYDVACGTHYTDKANKATLAGTTGAACCDPILNTCMSYTSAGVPFTCPSGKYAKELATVASVTGVAAKDCVNDAFDVTKVDAVVGYGPICPASALAPPGTADFAYRKCAFSSILGLLFLGLLF